MTDYHLSIQASGADGPVIEELTKLILDAAHQEKATILKNLEGSISQHLKDIVNGLLMVKIGLLHAQQKCPVSTLPQMDAGYESVRNVSRVCIKNQGGFALTMAFKRCPSHWESKESGPFDVGQTKCSFIHELLYKLEPGHVFRVQTHALAGLHQVIDPAFTYDPRGGVAFFVCTGSTLLYDCRYVKSVSEESFADVLLEEATTYDNRTSPLVMSIVV